MLKKALFSGAGIASLLAIQTSFAADLPSRKSPPVYAAPIFTWTGFHIGLNDGYGGGVLDANVGVAAPIFGVGAAMQTSNRASGFLVGGQAGYDYQFSNNIVVGIETDAQWSQIKASHQATTIASTGAAGYSYADIHNGLEWFGTTRARLGYSFGRLLPYVTGGVAYGQIEAGGTQIVLGSLFYGSRRDTKVGWIAGAGLDYALTDQLSARFEYSYLQLPGVSGPVVGLTPIGPMVGTFTSGSFGAHIIRTGFNWKFGGQGPASTFPGGLVELPSALWNVFFAPRPTLDWTGFYAGVNGGYGGGVTSSVTAFASPAPFASATHTNNHTGGFIAGGQIGYNYQFANNVVLGVETDGQWSDVKAWHEATTLSLAGPIYTNVKHELRWFGTTRLRAGYALGRVMSYATGGVAYGEVGVRGDQVSGGLFAGSTQTTKVGWAAGAGAEYALTDNLSVKAEYLYTEFSGVQGPAFGVAAAPLAPVIGGFSTSRLKTNTTRLGLNWRFGGFGAAPVVAKY
jgi:outer membrane immunogenic protein